MVIGVRWLALVPGFQFVCVCVDLGAFAFSLEYIPRSFDNNSPFRIYSNANQHVRRRQRRVQFSAAPLLPLLEIVL